MFKVIALAAALTGAAQAATFVPLISSANYPDGTFAQSFVATNKYDSTTAVLATSGSGGMMVNYFPPNTFATNINGAAIFNMEFGASLNITFSAPVDRFVMNFVANGNTGSTIFAATGSLNDVSRGTSYFTSSAPLEYDEGQINYSGSGSFDKLVISFSQLPSNQPQWAFGSDVANVGNLGDGGNPTVPEPSALLLGAVGALGLIRRRR